MAVPIWAAHYIGVPFVEHGRDRTGLDCWGLVRLVQGEQFNIPLPSLASGYRRTTDVTAVSRTIEVESEKWSVIKSGDEELGDVIVLRVRGYPLHVGLVLGDRQMLHIERGINSSIEKYNGMCWIDRISGFYRYNPFLQGGCV